MSHFIELWVLLDEQHRRPEADGRAAHWDGEADGGVRGGGSEAQQEGERLHRLPDGEGV